MKKQVSKRIIVFLVVLSLILSPVAGFSDMGGGGSGSGGFGGDSNRAVNTAVVLTVVFTIWTLVLISAIFNHSNLGTKKFSHVSRNKVSLVPLMGYLGLVQFTMFALMNNPAVLMALSYSKQRQAVTSAWSGNVPVNDTVTHGQSKGMANSVTTQDVFFPATIRIQF